MVSKPLDQFFPDRIS